jgi:diguanylate cyclase (GGDEF)-like protein
VAAAVRGEVRGDELFARCGGEEFAVVLPETILDDTARFCERIRAKVEAQTFSWKEHAMSVTISIGGTLSLPGEDQPALVARADARLYEAKRTGRNRCILS